MGMHCQAERGVPGGPRVKGQGVTTAMGFPRKQVWLLPRSDCAVPAVPESTLHTQNTHSHQPTRSAGSCPVLHVQQEGGGADS